MSWEGIDFKEFGAVLRPPAYADPWRAIGAVEAAPAGESVWDFGLRPVLAPDQERTVSMAASALRGTWDGKTSFSLWDVGRRLQGSFLKAQRQSLGTCVGRGWSGGVNLLQFAMLAAGMPIEFKPASHAVIYGGSREIAGNLAPPGGNNDGSYGSAAAKWVRTGGNTHLDEISDRYDSDKIAGQYGWKGVPANVKELAKDNLVSDTALVTTFEEAADMIWNGKPVPVCSGQGFNGTRDADGFCRAQGSWAHCMLFGAVIVTPSGRRGLGCGQSWGDNTPSGPLLWGCPDFVFGVEEATVNRMLRARDSYAMAGLNGWARQTWPLDWTLWN